jgi:hypothetical protein
MGFGIWGVVDHMPIHKRKEKKIICAYVQQAWFMHLALRTSSGEGNFFITWLKKP